MRPNLWAFAAVAVPLVLTPGVSTALVLRNSIAGGTRAGIETAVGLNAGSLCYGLLSAFGVAVALQRWPAAWSVLRLAGAAYLAWLGFESLRRAWTEHRRPPSAAARDAVSPPSRRNLYEGFATNILNPSIATFYLLILPQFIPRGAPAVSTALFLTAFHIALAATWLIAWAAAGGTLAHLLARRGPRRALEGCAGVALLALAMRLAFW